MGTLTGTTTPSQSGPGSGQHGVGESMENIWLIQQKKNTSLELEHELN